MKKQQKKGLVLSMIGIALLIVFAYSVVRTDDLPYADVEEDVATGQRIRPAHVLDLYKILTHRLYYDDLYIPHDSIEIDITAEMIHDSVTAIFQDSIDMNGNRILSSPDIVELGREGEKFYNFDGDNDYIDLTPVYTGLNITGSAVSHHIVYTCKTTGSKEYIFAVGWASKFEAYQNSNNTFSYRIVTGDDDITLTSNLTVEVGKRYSITAVYDGSNVYLYINDNLEDSAILTGNIKTYASNYTIGGRKISFVSGNVIISKWQQYTVALSTQERHQIENGQVPSYLLGASQENQVVNGDCSSLPSLDGNNMIGVRGTVTSDGSKVTYTGDGSSEGVHYTRLSADENRIGKTLKYTADVYIPSGNTEITSLKLAINDEEYVASNTISTKGEWITLSMTREIASDNYSLAVRNDGAGVTSEEFYVDNVSVKQVGLVADYSPSGIGDYTWQDKSQNNLHGTVDGATVENAKVDDTQKAIETGVTGDITLTDIIPAGYMLSRIVFEETAGNTATVDLGTSAGGSDVFSQETLTASSITTVTVNKTFSLDSDQTLYLNDDGAGTWNSGSVDCYFIVEKVE